jgi:hypothetical protein
MCKYRFAGTLKGIKYTSTDKGLLFVPDQECAVFQEVAGKKTKHAIFLPSNEKCEGIAFTYDDKVEITVIKKDEWLPMWTVGKHYAFILGPVVEEAQVDIKVTNAPISKGYRLDSVVEKV